jgi:hypothetical protein
MTDLEHDPIELARTFVAGRNLKRGETIQMVKGLLEALEKQTLEPGPATPQDDTVARALGHGCLIPVWKNAQGNVQVGQEAVRIFTLMEAAAFASKIMLVVESSL